MDNIEKIKMMWPYAYNAYNFYKANRFKKEGIGSDIEYIPILTTLGFSYLEINHNEKSIVYAVMGTEREFDSWFKNIKAISKHEIDISEEEEEHGEARVHQGLWDVFLLCKEKLFKHIDELIVSGYTIYGTGHSQGGGVIQVVKMVIDMRYNIDMRVVAFAALRVGGCVFCQFMENRDLTRCNVRYDIVPEVPPKKLGYKHAGKVVCLKGKWLFFRLVRGIYNHLPFTYEKRIREL